MTVLEDEVELQKLTLKKQLRLTQKCLRALGMQDRIEIVVRSPLTTFD